MPELIRILSEFRAGGMDQTQLLTRVESLLNDNGKNLDALMSALQQEHAMAPLPLGAFMALRKHLIAAAAPKTEILSEPPAPPSPMPVNAKPKDDDVAQQAIGATLAGRFRLVEFIGSGGTSRLYKAIDQRKVEAGADDKHVAVKILTLPFKDTLEALAVLHRETEGTQKLQHPNIVRVIDCDRDGDMVFMTMEFIGGKTLHALMRTSRFLGSGRNDCWAIIRDVASAVEFAHSKGVVHGDLTPGNIMVAISGGAKVIDFGIARMFADTAGRKGAASGRRSSSRGEIAGFSPSYAGPEVIELRDPDPRDDIYSLACIVWELLTGSHPFDRTNSKAAREAGTVLRKSDKLTRKEFAALARALNFDREKRTPTVGQFVQELTGPVPKRYTPYATAASLVMLAASITYAYLARSPESLIPQTIEQQPAQTQARLAVKEPQAAPAPAAQPAAGTVFRDCPTCPLMTAVPAGDFLQGSPMNAVNAQPFEMPQHRVTIAHAFAASRTEVTVGEYAEFVQATGRESRGCAAYDGAWTRREDVYWKNALAQQTAAHPVSCISWADAVAYGQWLSTRTGKTYRLPTASEWEFAARAGSTADRAWHANSEACAAANTADLSASQRYPGWTVHACNDAFAQAAPVASFAPNAFGLHDMLGNVFEWVADCWNDNYDGAPIDGSARQGGDCSQREMRGGSWFTAPGFVRFAYRNRFTSDYRSSSVGFRVVREI